MRRRQERELKQLLHFEVMRKQLQVSFDYYLDQLLTPARPPTSECVGLYTAVGQARAAKALMSRLAAHCAGEGCSQAQEGPGQGGG